MDEPSSPLRRYRFFFLFGEAADVIAPVQRLNMSLVALDIAAVDCRFASAAILPRAELATELAPLSQMLMNGFFFRQGLTLGIPLSSHAVAVVRLSQANRSLEALPICETSG